MFCVLAFVRLWQKEVRPHGLIRRVVVVVKKKRGTKSKREIDQMSNVKKKEERKAKERSIKCQMSKKPKTHKTEEQKKFWNATTVVIKNCVLVPWYFVVITKRRTS